MSRQIKTGRLVQHYFDLFYRCFTDVKTSMSHLVRSLDRLWNQFEPDLYRLQEKLEHAGLTLIDGEVTYIEENSNV